MQLFISIRPFLLCFPLLLLVTKTTGQTLAGEAKAVPLSDGVTFDVFLVDLDHADIAFYHQKENGEKIKNIDNLKRYLQQQAKRLVFATNGGMYRADHTPTGLYVENGVASYPLNMGAGGPDFTNFYHLKPNGVFYLQKNGGYGIISRENYGQLKGVEFATQSAPMILINGALNSILNKQSNSKFIRSGVGVAKKNGMMNKYELVFAISKEPITFYDFARIFKYYGCQEALYLDGHISEMYVPALQRTTTHNDFASIIAITEKL
ncbi:MAG: phosphodiester glycosidase family protein [Bacteroidota bacterium]